jgi:hypothetical protein
MLTAMQSIVALAKEGQTEWRGLVGDTDAFLQKTNELFPELWMTPEEDMRLSKGGYERSEKALERLFAIKAKGKTWLGSETFMADPTDPTKLRAGRPPMTRYTYGKFADWTTRMGVDNSIDDAIVKQLNAFDRIRYLANAEAMTQQRLRHFSQREKQAEIAHQLGGRLTERLENIRTKQARDPFLTEWAAVEKMRANLSTGIMTPTEIEQQRLAKEEKVEQDFARRRTKLFAQGHEGAKLKAMLSELEVEKAASLKSVAIEAMNAAEMSKESLEVFKQVHEAASDIIARQTEERDKVSQQIEMMSLEVSPEAVASAQKIQKMDIAAAKAAEYRAEKVEELNERIQEMEEADVEPEDLEVHRQGLEALKRARDQAIEEGKIADELARQRKELELINRERAATEKLRDWAKTLLDLQRNSQGIPDDLVSSVREIENLMEDFEQLKRDLEQWEVLGMSAKERGIKSDQLATMKAVIDGRIAEMGREAIEQYTDAQIEAARAARDFAEELRGAHLSTEKFIADQSGDLYTAAVIGAAEPFIQAASNAVNQEQVETIATIAQSRGLGDFTEDILTAGYNRLARLDEMESDRLWAEQEQISAIHSQIHASAALKSSMDRLTESVEGLLGNAKTRGAVTLEKKNPLSWGVRAPQFGAMGHRAPPPHMTPFMPDFNPQRFVSPFRNVPKRQGSDEMLSAIEGTVAGLTSQGASQEEVFQAIAQGFAAINRAVGDNDELLREAKEQIGEMVQQFERRAASNKRALRSRGF